MRSELELEQKLLREEIAGKDASLQKFREQELTMRREKQALIEQQRNLDLELQRKLDEERQKIVEDASQREAQKFQLREAEYRKKLEDAQHANDEMRRKLEQGSQQLQGEVLELEVEQTLASTFLHDLIEI